MTEPDNESAPLPVELPAHIFGFAFHPEEDIFAAGLITGAVECFRYGAETTKLFSTSHHGDSCRDVQFSKDGALLFSASKDKSLHAIDLATGKLKKKLTKAHSEPINRMSVLNQNLLVTGDDNGCVKLWDLRQGKPVFEYRDHMDFISDFEFVEHKKNLLVTSADGCLSIYDIRKPKPLKISENQDDELLSVTVLKDTKKAVVGTQDGVLSIFSWGDWGDCTDRFPGHPSSIESIAKLDESTIATGSSDGLVRVVSILPNKLAGVIGAHDEGFPVEKIGLSRDGRWLGSCSHDCTVQFWDVEQFMSSNNGDDDDDDEDDAQDEDDNEEKSGNVKRKPGSDDEDSSDDSDDSDGNKKRKKKKRQKAKRGIGGLTPAKSFFADLD